jgi:hypothetical protein
VAADAPLVREQLSDDEDHIRATAAEVYAGLATPEDVTAHSNVLLERLADENSSVRTWALAALTTKADRKRTVEYLEMHGAKLPCRALALVDWWLYAPDYVKTAYEKEQQRAE